MIRLYEKETNLLIGFFDSIDEIKTFFDESYLHDESNTYIKTL